MHRFVNTVALAAAVATLTAGLWQEWSLLTTVKRMALSYMGFFILGSLFTLLVLAVPLIENHPADDVQDDKPAPGGS